MHSARQGRTSMFWKDGCFSAQCSRSLATYLHTANSIISIPASIHHEYDVSPGHWSHKPHFWRNGSNSLREIACLMNTRQDEIWWSNGISHVPETSLKPWYLSCPWNLKKLKNSVPRPWRKDGDIAGFGVPTWISIQVLIDRILAEKINAQIDRIDGPCQ